MTLLPVPDTAIIVVAAGSGTRLDAGAPKALVGIDSHSILRHALDGVFAAAPAQVIIVAPAGFEGDAETEAREAAGDRIDLVRVVTGGETRQQSVAAGLAALWGDVSTVLVHDAARALTPPAQIDAVVDAVIDAVDAAGAQIGVIPALPVVDTLKRVDDGTVVAAVDRSELAAAQTPQGFPRGPLEDAYAAARTARAEYTDDAALFAANGGTVRHIAGSERAFKITTPADLERARHLLADAGALTAAPAPATALTPTTAPLVPRVGIGTDVHAFGGEGDLWLAGIAWPGEQPLSGHSDGDAVAHAIVDALLGAAGLGDIGEHFGTAHPEYAGAHAEVFLARTRELLAAAGFAIGNVSAQFQGNRPRFSARRAEAERALSAALGGAPVSVTATTTDALGFPGRGEGISVTAIAMVVPTPGLTQGPGALSE